MNLEKIYKKIPAVTGCVKGCTECCGPAPCSQEEFDAIPDIPEKLAPASDGNGNKFPVCRFKANSGCLIYQHRPLICRMFGAVVQGNNLICPRGARAKKSLGNRAAKKMLMKVMKGDVIVL